MDHSTIPREQAELELQAFCDEHELDLSTGDAEERDNLKQVTDRIIRGLMRGALYLNEASQLVMRTGDDELTFHEPTGHTLVEMDRAKGDIAKMNRLMAAICKVDPSVIGKMRQRHLKIGQAIVTLFMG